LRLSNGETVRARNILIATGSTPNHGEVLPGLEHVISSDKVFELRELPRRIIIQGGGYIAVEFACIFAGLGSKVTLVCRSDNILRGFDKDIRTHVRDALEQQEIRIVTGCQIKRVDRINESSGVLKASLSNTEQLIADQIMFAIGRKPNTQDLNLQRSGVALSADSGGVAVNENSQTNVPHIYAVGDVTNRVNLTPVAVREAQAFADSVLASVPRRSTIRIS
jgi:glutathione reductase (NADPH)